VKGYDCPICKDMKWVYVDVPTSDPRFGKAQRCRSQLKADKMKRSKWLQEIDGLTAAERQLGFPWLVVTDDNRAAVEAVESATSLRRGMVTLSGAPGTGKSTLLICAVNAAREANIPAVYVTMTDLLDHLRASFNPEQGDSSFDSRWSLLVSAEVLAIDELDEFNSTEWATERFLRLMDERWRHLNDRLTLLATNGSLSKLPGKVESRLRDGRASVYTLGGEDMRRAEGWE
jgi:DNA replication protein DnaC